MPGSPCSSLCAIQFVQCHSHGLGAGCAELYLFAVRPRGLLAWPDATDAQASCGHNQDCQPSVPHGRKQRGSMHSSYRMDRNAHYVSTSVVVCDKVHAAFLFRSDSCTCTVLNWCVAQRCDQSNTEATMYQSIP